ncbi:uncharacterized protein LOC134541920 [Bacillus rossius redtenbacheri]|uniref:uncharacterized protein LOC134541920 n=1 Tax=Bacillus rossius redtenbacheri TaxID=93214 RepID=UPI002FDEBCBC
MDKSTLRGKYCKWSKEDLDKALAMIRSKKISILGASKRYNIPRRTLGGYVKSQVWNKKKNGRPTVLTGEQEVQLVARITRLADVGFPLTVKVLRKCVYTFCEKNRIKQQFSVMKGYAGRKWLKGFLQRHPEIARRKAQHLNEARAQKINKFIVNDYFRTLKDVMTKLDIAHMPERIYNVDEKGCRLSLHRQPFVLAKTGSRRVHFRGKEHGENVTIVSCGNALGNVIPPMILFKGQRLKPEWADNLPAGSVVEMTAKGSMTSETFVKWLHHFSRYKSAGPCLLIMDGAKCHLDYSIVEAADNVGVSLLCLPSNTTHELQPMDKSVFGPFEAYWDEELMKFWTTYEDRVFNKQHFGYVFSPVWEKSTIPKNIKAGFEACGIFPFNPNRIPEQAFAPSETTTVPRVTLPPFPEPAQHQEAIRNHHEDEPHNDSEETDNSSAWDSDNLHGDNGTRNQQSNVLFSEILSTPARNSQPAKRNHPAINSRAVEVQKSLFVNSNNQSIPCSSKNVHLSASPSAHNQKNPPKKSKAVGSKENPTKLYTSPRRSSVTKKSLHQESWYCFLCKEDRVIDMRGCSLCKRFVHEECVGLTKHDKQVFVCPTCEV